MIMFIDVETTGLPENYNAPVSDTDNWPRLVEAAWIVCADDGKEISKRSCIIRPDGFEIPEIATVIHGITNERALEVGVSLAWALDEITRDIQAADLVVGHNIEFDYSILACEFFRLGKENPFLGKLRLCTMRASTEYCAIETRRGYKWPKLSELYWVLFGGYIEEEHRAINDVVATARCYFELVKRKVIIR